MNQVETVGDPKVAADGSAGSLGPERGAHEVAADGHCAVATNGQHQHRAGGHELDQARIERPRRVILVVLSGQFRADLSEFGTDDLQALLFEAADDATHETALDGVWLKNDEACFHVVLRELWGGKDSKKPSPAGHSADPATVPAPSP